MSNIIVFSICAFFVGLSAEAQDHPQYVPTPAPAPPAVIQPKTDLGASAKAKMVGAGLNYDSQETGCSADPGQVCEHTQTFSAPPGWEFCKVHVIKTHGGDGEHSWGPTVKSQTTTDVRVWTKAVGGPPYDRYGADTKFRIETIIVKDITPWERDNFYHCDKPVLSTTAFLCIKKGNAQRNNIINCVKGNGDCTRFTGYNSTCVSNGDQINAFKSGNCPNLPGMPQQWDYATIPNSPQCTR